MRKLVVKLIISIVALVAVSLVGAFVAFSYMKLDLPKIDKLQDYKPNLASQIYSKDGVLLAEIGLEKREIVEMKDVPARVIDAFLSAEDDKFFTHKGVDYFGVLRAMLANFKAGKVVQGGSTITQQVAKSLLLSSERSITRKLKDFILAQKIEEKLSKQEILYLYLNQVYLGGGYYGVKAAARGYFNKELKDITVAESAMLAGLLVAPGKYSPYVNPLPAKKRQGYVLERMYKLNKITKAQYEQALKETTVYHLHDDDLKAGYFTEWVRQKAVEAVGEKEFLTNGFIIKTSLDWSLQKIAEEEALKGAKEVDKRQGFKGPIGKILPEEFDKFSIESRRNILKKKSSYFTINQHAEKMYEYSFDEIKFIAQVEERARIIKDIQDPNFYPGIVEDSDFIKSLKTTEQYEAVVVGLDDNLRLIYVNLAGIPSLIPFEYFKWAHKRSVNENTGYYQEVSKPTSILKVGDIINVKIVKPGSMASYLSKESTLYLSKLKNASLMKSQKYLICELDQIPEVQTSLYSIDARSGEVISYVGGNDYKQTKFNRVIQAKRQPGSSFKPLLFAAALENGYSPTTIIMDTPEAMPGFDSASSWKPKNYDGEYKGPVTFRVALEQSRNIPTIKIADKIGVSNVLKFLDRICFNAKLENNLSIALGTFGVSPRDMVLTYAIFPNGGKFVLPKAILSISDHSKKKYFINEVEKDMKTISPDSGTGNQVYDPRNSFLMTHVMKGVITSGTGTAAREISANIAGKTGTTNDYVDAWFVGFTSSVVTGVWVGFDDNKTLGYGETGGKSALPIWKEYMRAVIKKYGDQSFEIPPGVTMSLVEKQTGRKVSQMSPGVIQEYFSDGIVDMKTQEGEAGQAPVKPRNTSDDEYFENQ